MMRLCKNPGGSQPETLTEIVLFLQVLIFFVFLRFSDKKEKAVIF